MKKRIISFFTAIIFIITSSLPTYAHSGRTDSNGGHRDNKNKSGLGSYHYHCGGYPAHLHNNGVCPYRSSGTNSSSSSSSSATSKSDSDSTSEAKWIGDKYWNGSNFATGWTKIKNQTYYFDEDGDKLTGWVSDDDDNTYYFNSKGVMATGWKKISGYTYFFSSKGYMRTGLRKIKGKTYYFNKNGVMKTGKVKFGNKFRYFDTDGVMMTGWIQLEDDTYYFRNKDGYMATGKLKINGQVYKFDEDGKLIQDE